MGYLFNMPGVAMDIKFCSVHAALNGDVEPSNFIEKCSTIKMSTIFIQNIQRK